MGRGRSYTGDVSLAGGGGGVIKKICSFCYNDQCFNNGHGPSKHKVEKPDESPHIKSPCKGTLLKAGARFLPKGQNEGVPPQSLPVNGTQSIEAYNINPFIHARGNKKRQPGV